MEKTIMKKIMDCKIAADTTYKKLSGIILPGIIVLILFLLIPGKQVFSSDTGISSVLSDVQQHMSNVKTVQTLFVEKKTMAMFDMPVIIKGKIYIENPDKFAWIVTSPVEYSLIIDKDFVLKWDKTNGIKRLSLKGNPMFKAVIEQITFWFSGSYASCKKDYDIKLIKKEPAMIKFIPKKHNPASKMLTSITLVFQKDKRYISKIKLMEKNTDSTELFFKDVKINSMIDPSVWKLNQIQSN